MTVRRRSVVSKKKEIVDFNNVGVGEEQEKERGGGKEDEKLSHVRGNEILEVI